MRQSIFYEIQLQESLEDRWQVWFDGLEMRPSSTGGTILSGSLPDQSSLHGILERIRDLNLTILSIHRLPSVTSDSEKGDPQ